MTVRSALSIALVLMGFGWAAQPVSAQIFPPGTTALDDVRGGAVIARAPGRLVQDGIARHAEFNDSPFSPVEITDTEPVISPRAAVLSQVIEQFFDELNTAIDAFVALLQARAGQSPFSNIPALSGALNR